MSHRHEEEAEEVPPEVAELEDAMAPRSGEPSDGEDLLSSCSPTTRVKRVLEEEDEDSSYGQSPTQPNSDEDDEENDEGDDDMEEDSNEDDDDDGDEEEEEENVMEVPAACIPKNKKRVSRPSSMTVAVLADVRRPTAPAPAPPPTSLALAIVAPKPKNNYKFLWQ